MKKGLNNPIVVGALVLAGVASIYLNVVAPMIGNKRPRVREQASQRELVPQLAAEEEDFKEDDNSLEFRREKREGRNSLHQWQWRVSQRDPFKKSATHRPTVTMKQIVKVPKTFRKKERILSKVPTPPPAKMTLIDPTIQAIVIGNKENILLINGKRLHIGSHYHKGKIIAIHPKKVTVLSKSDTLYITPKK